MANPKKGDRVLGPYRRRDRWRILIIAGDGARTYSDFASEATALRYKDAAETELQVTAGRTIAEALVEYEAHQREAGKKEGPIESTTWKVGRLFPDHAAPVASFRSRADGQRLYDALRAYVSPRTAKSYAPDSHRNMLIEARTFLRWCVDRKYTRVNVLEGVAGVGRRRKGQDKPQLRLDEARKWTAVALRLARHERKEGAIAALMAPLLGPRAKEITTRVVRDLDDNGHLLWIPDSKTEAGRRTVEVPAMIRPLLRRLARGKGPNEYLLGDGKKPRDRNYPSKWCKKIARLAGVPELGSHAMRRLHSTIATAAGTTGHLVAAQLGHENFSTTTESYVQRGTVERNQRRRAAELMQGRVGPRRAAVDDADLSDIVRKHK